MLLGGLALPALGWLLLTRYRDDARGVALSKTLSSLLFLGAGLLWPTQDLGYGGWIRAGLVLSLLGDLFLLGESKRALGAGIAAFLSAHVCYFVALAPRAELGGLSPLTGALLAAPLLLAGGAALRASWPKLGRLAAPASLYFLLLSALAWLALAHWAGQPREPGAALIGLGLGLFFVSDLAVARHRFVVKSFRNKLWGLPAYYAAQHLLAASQAWV